MTDKEELDFGYHITQIHTATTDILRNNPEEDVQQLVPDIQRHLKELCKKIAKLKKRRKEDVTLLKNELIKQLQFTERLIITFRTIKREVFDENKLTEFLETIRVKLEEVSAQ